MRPIDARGYRAYLQQLEGAPAPLAGDQLELLAVPAHHDRLKEPLASDALGKLGELLGGDLPARLVRARLNEVDLDLEVAGGGRDMAGRRRRRGERRGLRGGYEAAQSSAEAGFGGMCHC
jgi:hypothetical protein